MKIARTIAIIAASSFLSVAGAQAATDADMMNSNGQPIVAQNADANLMTGRSAMTMKGHVYHHHVYHHHMMHKEHMMHKKMVMHHMMKKHPKM